MVQVQGYAQNESASQPTPPSEAPTNSLATVVSTNNSNIPTGCSNAGFSFQNGQLILASQNSSSNPQLYLFHNNSDYEQLLLSHPTNTAMSAGWDSRLDQGQWSALAINQPGFVINCFGRKPGAIGYVDCKSVLEVCAYPEANVGSGNYWVAENKSLFDTLSSLRTQNTTTAK